MIKIKELCPSASWLLIDISQLVLIIFGVITLYYPILVGLVDDWLSNANYSHGFFIPAISGYMIYTMVDELRYVKPIPVNWGFGLLFLSLVQLVVGKVGSEFFLQRTSLIPLLLGLILFLLGSTFARKLLLPVFYLLFMIPLPAIIWNKIAFPLQLFASTLTEHVIRLFGIPVIREGNILHLAQTTLEVVDACSGLRSLTTMFALSAAMAWFTGYSSVRKMVLFLIAAPIAILANITRLFITAILASFFGAEVAQGFLHDFSGLVTFALGLVMLVSVSSLLSRYAINSETNKGSQ